MKRLLVWLAVLLVLALAAAGAAGWWAWRQVERPHKGYAGDAATVVVEPGTPSVHILDQLARRGVVADARLARLYMKLALGDPPLQAGEYRFEGAQPLPAVLDKLVRGDVVDHAVTIVEGLTLEETAQALAAAGFGERDALLAAMRDPAPIADLDPEAETLEGYLFPSTYRFRRGTTEAEVVATMVATFRRTWENEIVPLLEESGGLAVAEGAGGTEAETGDEDGSEAAAGGADDGGAGEGAAAEGEAPASAGGAGDATETPADARRTAESAPPRPQQPSAERAAAGTAPTPGAPPTAPRAPSPGEARPGPAGAGAGPAAPPGAAPPPTAERPPNEPVVPPPRRRPARTVRELVTLASLVEKEAKIEGERPQIAAVYANRLERGMGLYADPTVIYALKQEGRWDGNIRREDLRMDSPYNTYRHAGLPPGPIASPGLASLKAAAGPADTTALYFVARNDGTHVFADTLAEHNRNVDRWQRRYWREQRRKQAAEGRPDERQVDRE